jgi:hypothetical protein
LDPLLPIVTGKNIWRKIEREVYMYVLCAINIA